MRQASRQWYALLKKCLLALGSVQCLADSCVFRLVEGGEVAMHLVVNVDDIFSVGKKERWDQFGKDFGRLVPVKSSGELKWYSGSQGGREVDYFATDVHGRIGREVWCGMGQRYSDSYDLEALGF